MTIPATVSQFSMSVKEIAAVMGISEQTALFSDTVRATCLVTAMFLSNFAYKKLGLKKTIALGLFLQIVAQLVLPVAITMKSVPLLFFLKGMQGCNAVAFPLYISAILMWVDDSKAGISTAIFNGSFIAGSGIGAWLASKVIPEFGWKPSFYIIGGACLLLAVPVVLVTCEKKSESKISLTAPPQKKTSYKEIMMMPLTWILVLASLAGSWVSQSIIVDLPVYSSYLEYGYAQSGRLMFAISVVTVLASLLAGIVSDFASTRSSNKLRARCIVMAAGYVISSCLAFLLPLAPSIGYPVYSAVSLVLMFGVSWSCGSLWPLMNLVYSKENAVAGTSFCSSASTICNPIAPLVTGVLLGSQGHWFGAWLVASIISLMSFIACILLYKSSNPGMSR